MKIPNFALGSQVWNGAIITSSLCIWATCRFLTALDSQAWAIARLGVKQACRLAFQLRMEHFGSQDDIMWHLTHVCEWAKGCTILLLTQSPSGWYRHCSLSYWRLETLSRLDTAPFSRSRLMTFGKTEGNVAQQKKELQVAGPDHHTSPMTLVANLASGNPPHTS